MPQGERTILESGEPRVSVEEFVCPVCKEWNTSVKLSGRGIIGVILDPRTALRHHR